MENNTKPIKLIVISFIGGIIAVVLVFAVIAFINQQNDRNKTDSIYISNLDNCSKNMQKSLQESMRTNMYATIKNANDYNKKETLPRYEAVLREGSCNEKDVSISGVDGREADIKESTATLDIPEAKQSWAITYHWVPDGTDITTDLGAVIIPKCLSADQLIYGDFNCEKIMSLANYGTDKYDPVLQYMPYTGAGFTLAYNPDTKEIDAVIIVRASQRDNQELLSNLRGQVEYWFTHRNLDISSYTVHYTYTDTQTQSQQGSGE